MFNHCAPQLAVPWSRLKGFEDRDFSIAALGTKMLCQDLPLIVKLLVHMMVFYGVVLFSSYVPAQLPNKNPSYGPVLQCLKPH